MSSAEAECCEGCITFTAVSHLRMIIVELKGFEEKAWDPTAFFFNSKVIIT
jgi:hypothetical protein